MTLEVGEEHSTHAVEAARSTPLKIWWPVLVASLIIAGVNVAAIAIRIPYKCPLDPWESIIVADAYRASAGLPVYTTPFLDHATHIYGPLITYVTGFVFKMTGVNFWAARIMSVIGAGTIIATLSVIFFRKLPGVFVAAGLAMLLAINLRTDGYFMQARPDMEALALALLALTLMYQGFEKERYVVYGIGIIVLCIAYLFKQTAAMFALVPLIKLVLKRDGVTMSELIMIFAPPAVLAALIVVIRLAKPEVDYYMIEVLTRWPIQYPRLVHAVAAFLAFMPIIPVALALGATSHRATRSSDASDEPVYWLVAACIIAVPASIIAFSKVGGVSNSYIPALFPLVTLSIVLIARAWDASGGQRIVHRGRAHGFAWLLTFLLFASAFGGSTDQLRAITGAAHGDQRYPQVVQSVSKLKGRVVCPDDPTIPIRALGQTGRSLWAENDATLSPQMPDYLVSEIRKADYVVLVNTPWPKYLSATGLANAGFVKIDWDASDMGGYTLWRKRRAGESP